MVYRTYCQYPPMASRVPAFEYEPTLYSKRRALPHLFRMRRTPALQQRDSDQPAPVLLLILTAFCRTASSDVSGRNNREHANRPVATARSFDFIQGHHSLITARDFTKKTHEITNQLFILTRIRQISLERLLLSVVVIVNRERRQRSREERLRH